VPSHEQVRAAWNHHRGAALGAGLAAGGHAGIAEAKKRTVATIQARDDILTLVTDRDRRDEARAAARDPIVFERLFAHRGKGPSLDGKEAVEAHAKTPVPDGALLAFGPGVHEVDWRNLGRTSFPKDLTIRGAGIDRTLLTLSDLSTNSVVFNLHLEDLTIDCGNDGAFDLRSKGAAIRTERVRFVRFDAAHGGAYVFDVTQAGAVHCIDCEFVCGYGRAPGCGNVLRSIVAARFDDCLFDNFVYDLPRAGVFSGCTFRDCRGMEKRLERALAVPDTNGSHYFEGCRVLWTLPEEQREAWESKLRLRDWKAFQQAFQR
jgi:hypothetical protein